MDMEIKEKEFEKLSSYIRKNFGINLTDRKKVLVTARLHNTIEELGFSSFEEYYEYVIADKSGNAVSELINKISTNHTFFYREEKHFDFLQTTVLPYLYNRELGSRDIRIWSAGCSSGDEPYTIAMVLQEYFKNKPGWNKQILATDISLKALEKARLGIYNDDQISKLPKHWKSQYFKRMDKDTLHVENNIKSEVIFRRFNLMNEFPFKKKFHVIFCRNVMIYFNNETKNKLIQKFYDNLEPGGYLFIGHSETIERSTTKFKFIKPSIYRKE